MMGVVIIFQFTTYITVKYFILIVVSVGIFFQILLAISSYPFKKLIYIVYKYPRLDIEYYYFYYQKATAYRLLFLVHELFRKTIKISNSTSTFITVYCIIENNNFNLLFSLIAAICELISLSMPINTYSKIYSQAARKLEFALNNGDNIQEPELSKKLNDTYKEVEQIIEDNFQ